MNRSDLVRALAESAGLSQARAARAVDALFAVDGGIIPTALMRGDAVRIPGFGSFQAKRREARKGRNPRTGRSIEIGASTSASFRMGGGLRDALGEESRGSAASAGPIGPPPLRDSRGSRGAGR